jgi:hypothetical protein
MGGTNAQLPIGRQVTLPGHFDLPVTLVSSVFRRPKGTEKIDPAKETLNIPNYAKKVQSE